MNAESAFENNRESKRANYRDDKPRRVAFVYFIILHSTLGPVVGQSQTNAAEPRALQGMSEPTPLTA